MSNMLEQAIIDAEQLREAALKSAQQEIVEKYSEEVRTAVQQILEQPEDDLGLGLPEEEPEEEKFMSDVEMSHMSDDDALIEIPLDQLIAQAEMEPPAEEDMIDREDLDVGVPDLADEEEVSADEAPANRKDEEVELIDDEDEEVELNEEELVNALLDIVTKESVQIDAPESALDEIVKDEQEDDEEEEEEMIADNSRDGQEKVKEALAQKETEIQTLSKTIQQLKNILAEAKEGLLKLNLSNTRLLYTNKVLSDDSLNERQKSKIAEMISEAQTVDEARTVYMTLRKTMETTRNRGAQSLSEAVTRRSSTIISSRREKVPSTNENPEVKRWAVLAGLKRDQ